MLSNQTDELDFTFSRWFFKMIERVRQSSCSVQLQQIFFRKVDYLQEKEMMKVIIRTGWLSGIEEIKQASMDFLCHIALAYLLMLLCARGNIRI